MDPSLSLSLSLSLCVAKNITRLPLAPTRLIAALKKYNISQVNLLLCLIRHHNMKIYGGLEV
jgi:hypothetical protein